MARLGDVFEGMPAGDDALKGPDLKAAVTVRRRDLGKSGLRVPVPDMIERAGQLVRRAPDPGGLEGVIPVSLPRDLPEGATLRLRGQGGLSEHPDGHPGDLYLKISVESGGGVPWWAVALAALAAVGAVAWAAR